MSGQKIERFKFKVDILNYKIKVKLCIFLVVLSLIERPLMSLSARTNAGSSDCRKAKFSTPGK